MHLKISPCFVKRLYTRVATRLSSANSIITLRIIIWTSRSFPCSIIESRRWDRWIQPRSSLNHDKNQHPLAGPTKIDMSFVIKRQTYTDARKYPVTGRIYGRHSLRTRPHVAADPRRPRRKFAPRDSSRDERFTSRETTPLIHETLVGREHDRVPPGQLFTTVYSTRAERSRSYKNVFPISFSLFHVNRANSGMGTGLGVLYKFWEHGFDSSAKKNWVQAELTSFLSSRCRIFAKVIIYQILIIYYRFWCFQWFKVFLSIRLQFKMMFHVRLFLELVC